MNEDDLSYEAFESEGTLSRTIEISGASGSRRSGSESCLGQIKSHSTSDSIGVQLGTLYSLRRLPSFSGGSVNQYLRDYGDSDYHRDDRSREIRYLIQFKFFAHLKWSSS
jgi:hypothetical protein